MKILSKEMAMYKENRLSRRDAIKAMGVAGASLFGTSKLNAAPKLSQPSSHKKVKIVIVGGGTGGMIASARLRRSAPNAEITLIAPNATHLYQPGQTFVALGLYNQADNERSTADILEDRVKWIQASVTAFNPQKNSLTTDTDEEIVYDYLVIALGVEYDFEAIKGLSKEMIGQNGITSVYFNDTITGKASGGDLTKEWFEDIKRSAAQTEVKVLLSEPDTPVKGVGTGLDMLFLGSEMLQNSKATFTFTKPDNRLFPFDDFSRVLEKRLQEQKNANALYKHKLIAIDANKKLAIYEAAGKKIKIAYDFMHITPPMRTPKVLRDSELALQSGKYKGYLDVDAKTLQHKRYKNIFGLGDAVGIPLGKTGGSAQRQAVIIQDNLAAAIEGMKLPMEYNGYTVAPVKTEFGKILLAEFNEQEALPTFVLNPYKPRWVWWEIDLHVIRRAYFSLMMKGMM
jgi:sulfide:quinone oxidoreductase